jgi:hypothetical protein
LKAETVGPAAVPRDNGTNAFALVISALREAPWFWGLDFFEWQGSDGPQYGQVATLEAAKQTFRAAWDRRLQASGKS